MLRRVEISMDEEEAKHIEKLQKRFGVKSRSEFFRELVRRYEKLESEFNALNQCVAGYLKHPESSDETRAVLKTTMKNLPAEDWK